MTAGFKTLGGSAPKAPVKSDLNPDKVTEAKPIEVPKRKLDASIKLKHPTVNGNAVLAFFHPIDKKELEVDLKEGVIELKPKEGTILDDLDNLALRDMLKKEGWTDLTQYGGSSNIPLPSIDPIKEWVFLHPDSGPENKINGSIGMHVNGGEREFELVDGKLIVNDADVARELTKAGYVVLKLSR